MKHFISFRYLALLLFSIVCNASLGQDLLLGLAPYGGPSDGGTAFSLRTTGGNLTNLHKFINAGVYPSTDLIKAADGNFYGVAHSGIYDDFGGIIFKMTPAGSITVITYAYDEPGKLMQANDGSFYGMTSEGGSNDYGYIFKIAPTGEITELVDFDYDITGGYPVGSLIQGNDGKFYGMTSQGGTHDGGTIFRMTSSGKLTVVKNFDATATGGYPYGSLVQGSDGNFYGMTSTGGAKSSGTIFKITPASTFSVLKNLTVATGQYPFGSLIQGNDGNFYGMTSEGGAHGVGTVIKITPAGSLTVIKDLDDATTGGSPYGDLVQDSDSNFYSTTYSGGTHGNGTIFKITPTGVLTVLRHLSTSDGTDASNLCKNNDGYFYGTANGGGANYNAGTVFKISSAGSFKVLLNFPDNSRGFYPSGSLMQAKDGNFYGMTSEGGTNGVGSIFRLCTDGSYTILHSLNATEGTYPYGNLIEGSDGNFYGMTSEGGANGYGTAFKITPSGSITVLINFDYDNTGAFAYGSLVKASNGNFYGMTSQGGTNGYGTIFKMTPTGMLAIVKNFDDTVSGGSPAGSLVQGRDGNFYGMTYEGGTNDDGTIFKITPTSTFTVLKNLSHATGADPLGSLIQGSDSNFYGMTSLGGTNGFGTIFKVTSAGAITVLKNFDDTVSGSYSAGDLVQASDGNFYGMTSEGGVYYGGTIFKITPSGTFIVLKNLDYNSGGNPSGNLIVRKPNPVANPQSDTTAKNTTKRIKLTGSGGTPLNYTIASQPLHGTAAISKDTLTYTPATDYSGSDSLTFYITWGCQKSAAAKVNIVITAAANITLEAEDALLHGAIVASNQPGYTGSGFADYQNASGNFIEWAANAPATSSYLLQFRYANGGTADRPLKLEVNGVAVVTNLSFSPTGGWSTWSLSSVMANLNAGNNKIRLTTTGFNGPNVDNLSFGSSNSVQTVQRSVSEKSPLPKPTGFLKAFVVPNPAVSNAKLILSSSSDLPASYRIIDISGKSYKSFEAELRGHSAFDLPVQDLPDGSYIIMVNQGNLNTVTRFIVKK